MHNESWMYYLHLLPFQNRFKLVLHLFILILPPTLQKYMVCPIEPIVFVLVELLCHCGEDQRPSVFVDVFECPHPSRICVSMHDQMHNHSLICETQEDAHDKSQVTQVN